MLSTPTRGALTGGALALAAFAPTLSLALDSWYTVPGSGAPVGSGGASFANKIRGVNLGGWFVLENWMQPSLFNPANTPGLPGAYDDASIRDEWTFTSWLGRDGARSTLETHWDTWITEDDFRRMADYGLNAVRIPVPHFAWNLSTETEPYVGDQAQVPYIERALNWSSVYGMDVILDIHTVPGSQSGQDNSGRLGDVQFHWNATNSARAVDALGQMTAWATQDRFNGVVKAIELLNEPYIEAYKAGTIPWDYLTEYLQAGYEAVRQNEYIQEGSHEVMVMIHDAFQPLANWEYFFSTTGSTWINYAIDTHIYRAFSGAATDTENIESICSQHDPIAASQSRLPTVVGEFSLGTNTFCVSYKECFGVTLDEALQNITSTDGDVNMFLRKFWEAQQGTYEAAGAGWIFWNWKTELAPTWSYEQSVAQRWIPVDLDSDKTFTYDSSQAYCLTNEDYGNIPSFPSGAASNPAGTHSAVGPPIKTQAVLNYTVSSTASDSATAVASATAMVTASSIATSSFASASVSTAATSPTTSTANLASGAIEMIPGSPLRLVGGAILMVIATATWHLV